MSTVLFYDTETTGITNKKWASNDPRQPHIVQLAALKHDENKNVVGQMNVIIKPDGWTVPDHVAEIHGITTERAQAHGIPLILALSMFNNLLISTDIAIAHNQWFDSTVLGIEYGRLDKPCRLRDTQDHCTMLQALPHCKLPGRYGNYKWPKLIEAHEHFFGEGFDGAHDAMIDVNACARIYYHMQGLSKLQEPEIHNEDL